MIVIGLTGSIGMGKSMASGMLRQLGVPVHDADECVHRLLGRDGRAVQLVAKMFPESHDRVWRKIDRAKLGRIVFDDPEALAALEFVLHPLVRQEQGRFLAACAGKGVKIAALDIPLLFETGADRQCDYTICVSAPHFIQKQRVLSRGLPEAELYRRLSSQMADRQKRRLADFTVQTGLGRAYSYAALRKILQRIRNK